MPMKRTDVERSKWTAKNGTVHECISVRRNGYTALSFESTNSTRLSRQRAICCDWRLSGEQKFQWRARRPVPKLVMVLSGPSGLLR